MRDSHKNKDLPEHWNNGVIFTFKLRHTSSLSSVGSVDFSVNRLIGVTHSEYPLINQSINQSFNQLNNWKFNF